MRYKVISAELKRLNNDKKPKELKDLLETNLFIFKENLKMIFTSVLDQIWNIEMKPEKLSNFVLKEANKGQFAEITEVDEEDYPSHKESRRSSEQKSRSEDNSNSMGNLSNLVNSAEQREEIDIRGDTDSNEIANNTSIERKKANQDKDETNFSRSLDRIDMQEDVISNSLDLNLMERINKLGYTDRKHHLFSMKDKGSTDRKSAKGTRFSFKNLIQKTPGKSNKLVANGKGTKAGTRKSVNAKDRLNKTANTVFPNSQNNININISIHDKSKKKTNKRQSLNFLATRGSYKPTSEAYRGNKPLYNRTRTGSFKFSNFSLKKDKQEETARQPFIKKTLVRRTSLDLDANNLNNRN